MFTRVVSRKLLEPVYRFRPPKNEPKKSSSTLCKSFLFIKEIIRSFLLCENYRKLGISNAYLRVKHSMAEEKRRFHEKTCNSYLNPDVHSFRICNRWPFENNLKTVYMLFKTIDFNSKQLLGKKMDFNQNVIYLFHREKRKQKQAKFQEVFS